MGLSRIALPDTSVFLDFDGTITIGDSGRRVLEHLTGTAWGSIDADYSAGRIGRRECLSRQWELVEAAGGLPAARAIARAVAIDADFVRLVRAFEEAGADVTVVSDSFGFYADEVCAAAGVHVLTNGIDESDRLVFPWLDRCCACSSCGVCKQAPIKEARRRDRTTVLVGDGVSDYKAALLADMVFAKDDLADWCDDAGVEYRPFTRLPHVGRALLDWI